MIKKMKNIKEFCLTLEAGTRLIAKISIISVITAMLAAIYSYTCTEQSYHYELLLICDDLLAAARSMAATGFLSVLLCEYISKNK